MKRLVSKIAVLALVFTLVFALAACSGLNSSYRALMLSRSSRSDYFKMSFSSMSGRIVQRVTHTGDQDGHFVCTASLEEGEVRVYYLTPTSDVEQPLFTLSAGESISGEIRGYLTNGEDPKIVVEAGEDGARGFKLEISIAH